MTVKCINTRRITYRGAWHTRYSEQLAARLQKEPKPEPDKDPLAVDYAAEVSEALSRTIGRKVRLIEGKKGGRIEIEYVGADDREALIELLQTIGKKRNGGQNRVRY